MAYITSDNDIINLEGILHVTRGRGFSGGTSTITIVYRGEKEVVAISFYKEEKRDEMFEKIKKALV